MDTSHPQAAESASFRWVCHWELKRLRIENLLRKKKSGMSGPPPYLWTLGTCVCSSPEFRRQNVGWNSEQQQRDLGESHKENLYTHY